MLRTCAMHLNKNIATTNKLLIYVYLGDGWPLSVGCQGRGVLADRLLREVLDPITNVPILKDIKCRHMLFVNTCASFGGGVGKGEVWGDDRQNPTVDLHDTTYSAAKATQGLLRRALHKNNDILFLYHLWVAED